MLFRSVFIVVIFVLGCSFDTTLSAEDQMTAEIQFSKYKRLVSCNGEDCKTPKKDNGVALGLLGSAYSKGHPIAKLKVYQAVLGSLEKAKVVQLFKQAYHYSKNYPQYKSDIFDVAQHYFLSQSEGKPHQATYVALMYLQFSSGMISEQQMPPTEVKLALGNEVSELMSTESGKQVFEKVESILQAIEKDNWSWLLGGQ